ncbi:MAG: hypothetical protein EHM28_08250, partial [Spirochaetaceae bacterium]
MKTEVNALVKEQVLLSRIRGERTLAIIRLILLIPLFLFAVVVVISGIPEKGVLFAFTENIFILELCLIVLALLVSLWTLRYMKRKIYYEWMKYAIPAVDIALVSATVYLVSAPDSGLMFTGAAPWFFFIFLVLESFRNSKASIIFTGSMLAIVHLALCINAMATLDILGPAYASIVESVPRQAFNLIFEGQTLELTGIPQDGFVNPRTQYVVRLMLDDVFFKFFIILIMTALLTFMARRFNLMIQEQISTQIEKENLRTTVVTELKTVTQTIGQSSSTLVETSRQFADNLKKMVGSCTQIKDETQKEYNAVEETSATVTQMIRSVESVAKNIEVQAGLVTTSVTAVEEIGATISQITQTSQKANSLAGNLLTVAESGEHTMEDVVQAIHETESASKKIEEIVEIISSIAGETDLLAMNAAIEAAHAGDAGKGFAVVADEIRTLAESSSQSTKSIAEILKDLSARISHIVSLVEKSFGALGSILSDARETSTINK